MAYEIKRKTHLKPNCLLSLRKPLPKITDLDETPDQTEGKLCEQSPS